MTTPTDPTDPTGTEPTAADATTSDGTHSSTDSGDRVCPRCSNPVPPRRSPHGRPAVWCSPRCRKAASAQRRAAQQAGIPVRIERIEYVREVEKIRRVEVPVPTNPTPEQATAIVLNSPAACRKTLKQLTKMVRDGTLDNDRAHHPTREAAWQLAYALSESARHQRSRP